MWRKHRHFYRLITVYNSPKGYMFVCKECLIKARYSRVFIEYNKYWSLTEGGEANAPGEESSLRVDKQS